MSGIILSVLLGVVAIKCWLLRSEISHLKEAAKAYQKQIKQQQQTMSMLRNMFKHGIDGLSLNHDAMVIGDYQIAQQWLFISQLDGVLAQCFCDPKVKISDIANHMAVSERQLHRKLTILYNMTPSEYLRRFRLKQAAVLLRQGEQVGNVALDVGFATHAHFSKCFKQMYAMTPSQYQSKCHSM